LLDARPQVSSLFIFGLGADMGTRIVALGFLVMLVFSARTASAGPITVDGTWREFGFFGAGSAGTDCPGCIPATNPAAVFLDAPPWTFSGPATITVLDLFISGDTFQLFDNLVAVGSPSAPAEDGDCGSDIGCALADAAHYSRLIAQLGAGAHSLTINAVASPTGGGAAVFQAAAPATAVPEPATMLLLGSGLAGVAARARRRRNKAKA
jgi:hypothetical protein